MKCSEWKHQGAREASEPPEVPGGRWGGGGGPWKMIGYSNRPSGSPGLKEVRLRLKTPPADESALLSAASFPLGTFLEKLEDVISEGRDES